MNGLTWAQRIEKLINESYKETRFNVCALTFREYEVSEGKFVRSEFDKEKFAELIIRECLARCEGNGEYKNHTDTEWGKGLAAGIELCKLTIKDHFGVN